MFRCLFAILRVCVPVSVQAQAAESPALDHSVDELRSSVGLWEATTEFLNDDGSVARAVTGTYEFNWVVEDQVLAGKNAVPELGQASGILFYVNETKQIIEMVSVGAFHTLQRLAGRIRVEDGVHQRRGCHLATGEPPTFPEADGLSGLVD